MIISIDKGASRNKKNEKNLYFPIKSLTKKNKYMKLLFQDLYKNQVEIQNQIIELTVKQNFKNNYD